MQHRAIGAALIAAIASLLAGCASSNDALEDARARWQNAKPARYVVQTCTTTSYPPGCVRAAVDNETPVAAEERIYYPPDDLGWERLKQATDPIEDMFDAVQHGKVKDCAVDQVTYDEVMGFVSSYELVCDGYAADGHWVACLKPGTLDLEDCDSAPDM